MLVVVVAVVLVLVLVLVLNLVRLERVETVGVNGRHRGRLTSGDAGRLVVLVLVMDHRGRTEGLQLQLVGLVGRRQRRRDGGQGGAEPRSLDRALVLCGRVHHHRVRRRLRLRRRQAEQPRRLARPLLVLMLSLLVLQLLLLKLELVLAHDTERVRLRAEQRRRRRLGGGAGWANGEECGRGGDHGRRGRRRTRPGVRVESWNGSGGDGRDDDAGRGDRGVEVEVEVVVEAVELLLPLPAGLVFVLTQENVALGQNLAQAPLEPAGLGLFIFDFLYELKGGHLLFDKRHLLLMVLDLRRRGMMRMMMKEM